MTVKTFIKKAVRKVIRLCLTPLYYVNRRVKNTNWYRNVIPDIENYPTNAWYRKHLERNYDLVVVGSSVGVYDFDLSIADIKAFNWSMQPLAMEYGLRVLMNYHSILRRGGVVVVPFSPFSGLSALGKQGKTTDDRFYHLLDSTLIDNVKDVMHRREYPLFYQTKQSVKRLIKDVPPKKRGRNCNVCHTAEEFDRDAEWWMSIWKREFSIDNTDAPLTEENIKGRIRRAATVQQIIDFCVERDLKPVFVLPPVHPALASRLSKTFRNNYIYSFMEQFTEQGVMFYDYLDAERFDDDTYFSNSYFMSEEGAKAFTTMFLKDLGLTN